MFCILYNKKGLIRAPFLLLIIPYTLYLILSLVITIDVKRMIKRSEVVHFACCINNLMNSGIAEFYNLTCFNINEMIMLATLVCSFKLGNVFSELMFYYQVTVEQQLNCII